MSEYKYSETSLINAQIARVQYQKIGFIVSTIERIAKEFVFYVTK